MSDEDELSAAPINIIKASGPASHEARDQRPERPTKIQRTDKQQPGANPDGNTRPSFTPAEVKRLAHGGCLGDGIVEAVLTYAAAAAPTLTPPIFTTPSSLDQNKLASNPPPLASLVERALAVGTHDKSILAVVKLDESQWVVFRLSLTATRHRCKLFNSARLTQRRRQECHALAIKIITQFLPPRYHNTDADWNFALGGNAVSGEKQSNEVDSSIVALITVWHLLFSKPLPVKTDPTLWRAVFATLLEDDTVPPDASTVVDRLLSILTNHFVARDDELEVGKLLVDDATAAPLAESKILSTLATRLAELSRLYTRATGQCKAHEVKATEMAQSARDCIQPLLQCWIDGVSAFEAQDRQEVLALHALEAPLARAANELSSLVSGDTWMANNIGPLQQVVQSTDAAIQSTRQMRELIQARCRVRDRVKVRMMQLCSGAMERVAQHMEEMAAVFKKREKSAKSMVGAELERLMGQGD